MDLAYWAGQFYILQLALRGNKKKPGKKRDLFLFFEIWGISWYFYTYFTYPLYTAPLYPIPSCLLTEDIEYVTGKILARSITMARMRHQKGTYQVSNVAMALKLVARKLASLCPGLRV